MAGAKQKHKDKGAKLDAAKNDAEREEVEQGTFGDKHGKDGNKQKKSKKQVKISDEVQVHEDKPTKQQQQQQQRQEAEEDDPWGGDSDDDEDNAQETSSGLTINRAYARHYEEVSKRKELQRLQREALDSDESESEEESEDEDAEALDPLLDAQIMKTVALIRKRDPSIYDSSKVFFERTAGDDDEEDGDSDADDDSSDRKKAAHKKQRYKDLVRQQLLEKGAELSDDEDDAAPKGDAVPLKAHALAYDEEQRQLRKAFLSAGNSDDEDEDGEGDDLLQVREKTAEELEEEKRALESAIVEIQTLSTALPKEEQEKDAFLTQYMLQQKWKDDMDELGPAGGLPVPDEQDEEDLGKMDEFESKYNFRFEEEGGVEIQSYARNVAGSVRKVDDSRKKQREARKERKEKEKLQKLEELKRLKNLKREEIKKKLDEIAKMSGGAVFDEKDLEEDWDPEAFERRMQQTFDESYYEQEDPNWNPEAEGGDEEQYPEEAWEEDDAYYQGLQDYGDGQGEEHEELQKRNKIQALVSEKDRLIDELYQLDHEDIVAGIPTRFKYRTVDPDDFGLTTEEILFADDTELNQYLSLKALAPYREHVPRPNPKKRKRLRQTLREKLKQLEEEQAAPAGGKSKRKQNESTAAEADTEAGEEAETAAAAESQDMPIGSRRKRHRKRLRAPKEENEAAIVPTARPVVADDSSSAAPAASKTPSSSSSAGAEAGGAPSKPKFDKKDKHNKPHKSKPGSKNKPKDSRLASYGL